jgi:hypothetical protein
MRDDVSLDERRPSPVAVDEKWVRRCEADGETFWETKMLLLAPAPETELLVVVQKSPRGVKQREE